MPSATPEKPGEKHSARMKESPQHWGNHPAEISCFNQQPIEYGESTILEVSEYVGDQNLNDVSGTSSATAPSARAAFMRVSTVALFVATAVGLVAGRAAGWVPFSWIETVGAVTGGGCVLLVVLRNVWNFPVGIVSCMAYLVFFAQGRLYADAGLQVVFILLSIHGWIAWVRGRSETTPVRRVPLGELTVLVVGFPAIWLGLRVLLEHVGGAAPTLDAFVTALSLVAQWLLNRRYIETWLGWIVVDQVSVALFWSREMYLTAGLYAVFLGMCVTGFIAWRQELRGNRQ